MTRLALILLGPPGAGKGTQARKLCRHLSFPRISTGDILREAVRAGTGLGKEAQKFMESGGLVPDSVVDGIVKARVHEEDCRDGFVLDGYPRTLGQAEFLETVFEGSATRILAIGIEVGNSVLVQRLSGRWTCPGCGKVFNELTRPARGGNRCDECDTELVHREDDSARVIEERLHVYHAETRPLIEFYRERDAFVPVNGEGTPEEVFESILSIVQKGRENREASIH